MFRTFVLTVSDRCFSGEMRDESGPMVEETLPPREFSVFEKKIVPDDIEVIKGVLLKYAGMDDVDLIVTTGGTGFSPRDVTPEATAMVVQRRTPGIDFMLYSKGMQSTPHAVLSRGISGIRHQTLIVNLPGGTEAVVEYVRTLSPILPHALRLIQDNAPDSDHLFISSGTGGAPL